MTDEISLAPVLPSKMAGTTSKRSSITFRIVMMQAIIVVMIVIIVGVASYRVMVSQFNDVQESGLQASAAAVATLVSNDFKNLGLIVERLAKSEAVQKYQKSFNEYAIGTVFRNSAEIFPVITYVNALGEEEVKFFDGNLSSDLHDIEKSWSFSESERKPNQIIVSPPHVSALLQQPVYTLSYRYLDYFDQFIGLIQVTVPLERFEQVLQDVELGKDGYIVLVNARGDILHAPDARWLGLSIDSTDTDIALLGALSSSESVMGRYEILGIDSVVMHIKLPQLGLSAFVAIPTESYFGPMRDLTHAMVIVGLAALIIGLLVAYLFARSLAKPIKLLTRVTSEISTQGTITERVNWNSKDELGQLAYSFNQMLDQLDSSHAEVVDARHEVEDIIRSMADSLMVVSPDGTIVKVNEATIRQLGYSEQELIDMPIENLIAEEEALFKAMLATDMAKHGEVSNIETTLLTQDHRKIPVVFSGSVMLDNKGRKRGVVFVAKDITERKRAEEHLNYLANHDSLTGLPNRMLFLDRISQVIPRLPWRDRYLGVLFLDLDRFKTLNDTLGHDVGDLLLKGVAERLKDCVRDGDTVARLGGDEFVIMLNDVAKKSDVAQVAKNIIKQLSVPFDLAGEEFVATTSIGVSLFPVDGNDPHVLLKNADTAMYRAKDAGRNNFKFYSSDMNEKAAQNLKLEIAIRRGLEREEFILYYQPQVSLHTGEIIGVEALARWIHPEEGLIPPFNFLPVAEETGLIVPMGEQLLYQACRQGERWNQAGLAVKVAVNIAERQFKHVNLPKLVSKVLTETGFPPEYLDLELTEGILMDQVDQAVETLETLKEMGVSLSLDDFGTGYSSLSYLKRFAIDTLKVDRSFVMDIPKDEDDMAITRAVVEMGRSLGLQVIAEGVEDEAQLQFLKQIGCQSMQGFYFSKPVPADEVQRMLEDGKSIDVSNNNFKVIEFRSK